MATDMIRDWSTSLWGNARLFKSWKTRWQIEPALGECNPCSCIRPHNLEGPRIPWLQLVRKRLEKFHKKYGSKGLGGKARLSLSRTLYLSPRLWRDCHWGSLSQDPTTFPTHCHRWWIYCYVILKTHDCGAVDLLTIFVSPEPNSKDLWLMEPRFHDQRSYSSMKSVKELLSWQWWVHPTIPKCNGNSMRKAKLLAHFITWSVKDKQFIFWIFLFGNCFL